MKSRVNRARNKLAAMLSLEDSDRFGPDQRWAAAAEAPLGADAA
jgi:hypothetical protein